MRCWSDVRQAACIIPANLEIYHMHTSPAKVSIGPCPKERRAQNAPNFSVIWPEKPFRSAFVMPSSMPIPDTYR